MRIVNNKIYISQGETPTYSAVYRDKNTGEPFKIAANAQHPFVNFIVRDSVYKTMGTPRINYQINWDTAITVKGGGHRLDEDVLDYDGSTWSDTYFNTHSTSQTALYRKLNANEEYEYKYFGNDDTWHDYSFRMVFPFLHEDTKELEAKTYTYEIVLTYNTTSDPESDQNEITYKEVILPPTEFVVGGSLSE